MSVAQKVIIKGVKKILIPMKAKNAKVKNETTRCTTGNSQ